MLLRMVVFHFIFLFLLFHSTFSLMCYKGNDANKLKYKECRNGLCEVLSDSMGDLSRDCVEPYMCGGTGGYCCDEDGCNDDFPDLDRSISCAMRSAVYNPAIHDSTLKTLAPKKTYFDECSEHCKRLSFNSRGTITINDTKVVVVLTTSNYGCVHQKFSPCLVFNTCYIDTFGMEICCCDQNKCNTKFPLTSLVSDGRITRISCYTSQSVEDTELCDWEEVCIRTEKRIGCAKLQDCTSIGICCMEELCNDEMFGKREESPTCTYGIFLGNGTELMPKNKVACPAGCARDIVGNVVTFRCAGFECIGKADGCEGSRCCCFAADCATVDLYPLPSEFKGLIPILTKTERNYAKGERAVDDKNPMEGGDYEQVEVIDDGSGNTKISLLILSVSILLRF